MLIALSTHSCLFGEHIGIVFEFESLGMKYATHPHSCIKKMRHSCKKLLTYITFLAFYELNLHFLRHLGRLLPLLYSNENKIAKLSKHLSRCCTSSKVKGFQNDDFKKESQGNEHA